MTRNSILIRMNYRVSKVLEITEFTAENKWLQINE